MKTTLSERSLFIKEHLEDITREILDVAKNKIAMIILFGSYGRGDWARDEYSYKREYDVYQSDLDIMVIVMGNHGERSRIAKIERDIDKRLEKKDLLGLELREIPVTIMLDHISVVNKYLERGQYFYSDIKKEGILLYDSGKFQLAEPKELPWEEVKEITQ
jgi:predicted nucleotidyltransferase